MEAEAECESKNSASKDLDDDLEDGEIESDDDEPIITSVQPAKETNVAKTKTEIPIVDLVSEKYSFKSQDSSAGKASLKRQTIVDDDWAGNIENAIAAALKKDGIEPPLPKIERRDESKSFEDHSKIKGRKRKKRDNDKERSKKKSRHAEEQKIESDIDEFEMLCMRGASPPPTVGRLTGIDDISQPPVGYYDSDGSYTSYDSWDSVEYRKSYEERRQSRRNKDRRQRKSGRSGTMGSEKRRNDSDLGEDCPRQHDARPIRKLELCKFYLMECCAKKEKCSYMHGDFPCKYYYLGMECVYKGSCKFSHGQPLTEQLRNILLKHIETAPKEILGNFRRITRENAIQLLNQTHAKLCIEHGIENTLASTSPISTMTATIAPSSNKQMNNSTMTEQTSSIPSLLDMVIKPPTVSPRKDDKDKLGKGEKPRKSRWCDSLLTQSTSNVLSSQSSTVSTSAISKSTQSQPSSISGTINTITNFLSLKNLTGVITNEQIEKLSALGIENLEQVNQLTVAQLNSIGLTISQINEIQLNALNIQKLGLIGNNSISGTASPMSASSTSTTTTLSSTTPSSLFSDTAGILPKSSQDVDMRFLVTPPNITPLATTSLTDSSSSVITTSPSVTAANDVQSATQLKLSDTGIASPEPAPNSGKQFSTNFIGSSSVDSTKETLLGLSTNSTTISNSFVDYSQYLKDSNLDTEKTDFNDISLDKDDDPLNEDEPELLIDESWCPSEDDNLKTDANNDDKSDNTEENSDKSDQKESPPMPAIYDPKNLLSSSMTNKIDISSSVSNLLSSGSNQSYLDVCGIIQEKVDSEAKLTDQREYRDPRLSKSLLGYGSTVDDDEIRSPVADICELPKYDRSSIYDGTPAMFEDDVSQRKPDLDMRASSSDSNKSDMDFRLPFKSVMTNYTPASEIDGSISSHPPIPYKVCEIEIPRPDYSEIRKSVPIPDKTLDPRLRRIFCLKEPITPGDNASDSDVPFFTSLSKDILTDKGSLSGPRMDPRRKKENSDVYPGTSSAIPGTATKSQSLDIRMLLQKSDWYKNLNSKYKIMVNQQLALVSTELKKFHQDPSPNKVFDIQFIVSNQYLQQILTNLGIYIDGNGEVRQLENDSESSDIGNQMAGNMMGLLGMMDPSGMPITSGPPPILQMDFLRGPPPMNLAQRYMGNMMPFAPRFPDAKPGLLGIAPGVQFNPYDSGNNEGNFSSLGAGPGPSSGGFDDQNFPGDGSMFTGGNFQATNLFDQNFFSGGQNRHSGKNEQDGGGGPMRRNRNFRQGNNSRGNNNNDRWGGGSGGGGPRNQGGNRRNYDNRGGSGSGGRDRDSRREKTQK